MTWTSTIFRIFALLAATAAPATLAACDKGSSAATMAPPGDKPGAAAGRKPPSPKAR